MFFQVLSIFDFKKAEVLIGLIEAVLIQGLIAWWFGKFEGYKFHVFLAHHVSRNPIFFQVFEGTKRNSGPAKWLT